MIYKQRYLQYFCLSIPLLKLLVSVFNMDAFFFRKTKKFVILKIDAFSFIHEKTYKGSRE
jgi:hypothetical protein